MWSQPYPMPEYLAVSAMRRWRGENQHLAIPATWERPDWDRLEQLKKDRTMPTYDTRNDAILAAFRGMRPGESLLLHRKVEGIEHNEPYGDCPCKPVAVERRVGQSEREFLKDVQERLGN